MWTVFWLKPFVIYLSRKGVTAAQPSNELLPGSVAGAGAGGGEERVMVGRLSVMCSPDQTSPQLAGTVARSHFKTD